MAIPDAACPAMLHALALFLSASGVDHDLFMALYWVNLELTETLGGCLSHPKSIVETPLFEDYTW
jgi:hypothetical protein